MLLAIDVGNTQTVLGVYKHETLHHLWRVATNKQHTADELRIKALSLLASEGLSDTDLCGVALASVVPHLTDAWCDVAMQMTGSCAVVCSAQIASDLFRTNYPNPHEIGADRVADAVAAKALFGFPVVVVDFGTATNIEVIDNTGEFVGGVIAPGMETSSSALFEHAAKLRPVSFRAPHSAIGRTTEQAVLAGIVYGEADKVDGLVRRIFAQLGYKATVVATGGLATSIAPQSETITISYPNLTLDGLRLIYERVAEQPK